MRWFPKLEDDAHAAPLSEKRPWRADALICVVLFLLSVLLSAGYYQTYASKPFRAYFSRQFGPAVMLWLWAAGLLFRPAPIPDWSDS